MVLTNVNVWKTFAIARDSSDGIGSAMKSTQKTAMAKDKNETGTKAIKYPDETRTNATKKPKKNASNLEM